MATRTRRGKTVEIPPEWENRITTDRTKRARKKAAMVKIEGRRKTIRRLKKTEEILGR